eukprot:3543417-Pleurochrysis_carterae.AAC.2
MHRRQSVCITPQPLTPPASKPSLLAHLPPLWPQFSFLSVWLRLRLILRRSRLEIRKPLEDLNPPVAFLAGFHRKRVASQQQIAQLRKLRTPRQQGAGHATVSQKVDTRNDEDVGAFSARSLRS